MTLNKTVLATAMIKSKKKVKKELTNPPGVGVCPTGVPSPLLIPLSASARLALCSANRFFISDTLSVFGFFDAGACPCVDPEGGFPVTACRSASAWWNWVSTRWLWPWMISSGTPSMPKISTSKLDRLGSALSTPESCSLWT